MTNHQPETRGLARVVGARATELGCQLTSDDPSVAELILECASRRISSAEIWGSAAVKATQPIPNVPTS
jgi:hypothetical protein